MRGRKKKELKEEQEQEEVELSERMEARHKVRRKHFTSVVITFLLLVIIGLMAYLGARGVVLEAHKTESEKVEEFPVTAEVVDETGSTKVSMRTMEYIGMLEADLADYQLKVTKVVLPTNTRRQLFVDIEGETTYFKVNMDRGTGVTAEDIARMLNFLHARDLHPSYVDVRIEGKAYYK